MSFFGEAINVLASYGFYDFFLPWMLILAVVFGVLQNKQYISDQVAVNAAIALAVSFLGTAIAHSFFVRFFTFGSMAIAGFLLLIIFAAMFGFKPNELIKDVLDWNTNAMQSLIILAAGIVFLFALGFNFNYIWALLGSPVVAFAVIAIVFVIIVKFVTGGGGHGGGDHGNGH